ncbi:Uncharacterised protein [uncultured archaeon]|nr:Uncharacterised protein [uncultured archaeon]
MSRSSEKKTAAHGKENDNPEDHPDEIKNIQDVTEKPGKSRKKKGKKTRPLETRNVIDKPSDIKTEALPEFPLKKTG